MREQSDVTATFWCPWGFCFQTVKTTINTIPDKHLFHNMTQFLLFYGQNYFVIKLQKTLKHARSVREALEEKLKENKNWR